MEKLKQGKEEIIYLLTKCVDKYQHETGKEIILNTNRKNYEGLAITLSEISNKLPYTSEEKGHDIYGQDYNPKNLEFPYRKYDITGGQIKDAINGIVSNPRPFLVDACYIYLFGIGRKHFEKNPLDSNLVEQPNLQITGEKAISTHETDVLKNEIIFLKKQQKLQHKKLLIAVVLVVFISIFSVVLLSIYSSSSFEWNKIKSDMNILPYQPTKAEIDSLEGIWLCYTGSPQARISDNKRYHKVVPNLIEIKYANGYFTFNRYGASFNHIGFMQFESPGIVSVYSRIKNNSSNTESPRHSLLNLNLADNYLSAISASWNFDIGEKNKIIGIREVMVKQGKGGNIEEIINEIENASCQCKIIRWHKKNKEIKNFYLKNELLDTLELPLIKPLIDEKSILLNQPQDGLIITNDSLK